MTEKPILRIRLVQVLDIIGQQLGALIIRRRNEAIHICIALHRVIVMSLHAVHDLRQRILRRPLSLIRIADAATGSYEHCQHSQQYMFHLHGSFLPDLDLIAI